MRPIQIGLQHISTKIFTNQKLYAIIEISKKGEFLMKFENAIALLRDGNKIRRSWWCDFENDYIFLNEDKNLMTSSGQLYMAAHLLQDDEWEETLGDDLNEF